MLDEKELQAIKALFSEEMDKKLQPVNNRLDRIEGRLDELKEYAEETRGAVNYMVEWIEKVEKKVDEIA